MDLVYTYSLTWNGTLTCYMSVYVKTDFSSNLNACQQKITHYTNKNTTITIIYTINANRYKIDNDDLENILSVNFI